MWTFLETLQEKVKVNFEVIFKGKLFQLLHQLHIIILTFKKNKQNIFGLNKTVQASPIFP